MEGKSPGFPASFMGQDKRTEGYRTTRYSFPAHSYPDIDELKACKMHSDKDSSQAMGFASYQLPKLVIL